MRRRVLALATILLGAGAMGCGTGLHFLFSTQSFVSRAQAAEGLVIGHEEVRRGSEIAYAPIIRYAHNAKGDRHDFTSPIATSPPLYPINERVRVLHTKNPLEARIDSFRSLWLLPSALLTLGALLSLAGARSLMKFIRQTSIEAALAQAGRRVRAKVVQIRQLESPLTEERAYIIIAEWVDDDGRLRRLESDPLSEAPPPDLQHVNFLVFPRDPSVYRLIDFNSLEEKQRAS
jgi:hypothetical protein